MQRDPYRPLHKAIRSRLFEFGNLAGTIDFSDGPASQSFSEQFEGLVFLLTHHGEHEDEFIHPLVARCGADDIVKETVEQHEALDRELADLQAAITDIAGGKSAVNPETSHQVYLQYQRFLSNYLAHLDHEETVVLPLLRERCSDADFDELARADFADEDPLELRPMLGRMLPSFNDGDMALLLSDIRRVVSDEVFQQYCDLFGEALPPQRWAAVETLLTRE